MADSLAFPESLKAVTANVSVDFCAVWLATQSRRHRGRKKARQFCRIRHFCRRTKKLKKSADFPQPSPDLSTKFSTILSNPKKLNSRIYSVFGLARGLLHKSSIRLDMKKLKLEKKMLFTATNQENGIQLLYVTWDMIPAGIWEIKVLNPEFR